MKILYAGNLVNGGYYHTKFCREQGLDMELLMEKDPTPNNDPFQYDPLLKEYPNWIKFYDREKKFWQVKVIQEMRNSKYELIHSHVELPMFARFSGKKFIAHTLGSDLKEMAFTNSFRGILLRQAYKRADIVVYSTPDQPQMLDKLKIHNKLYLPLLRDLQFFKKNNSVHSEFSENFLVFHPTTHLWKFKGNDILIKAFAKFLKSFPDSLLIMIDKGVDLEKSKQLIKNLNIENKTKFLPRLNSIDLAKYYNLADIIADQFIEPGLGGIGIESLSCGKPLLNSCPEGCYVGMHQDPPPVIHASNVNELSKKLEMLNDKKTCKKIGDSGLNWVKDNLSPKIVYKKYLFLYNSLISGDSFEKILENSRTY